jgi:hypothetical protein
MAASPASSNCTVRRRAAATAGEGLEGAVPLRQVFELLAEGVEQKRQGLGRLPRPRREAHQGLDVRAVASPAHAGQQPVSLGVVRRPRQGALELGLGRVRVAEEHQGVGQVDAETHLLRRTRHRLGIPVPGRGLVAEQRAGIADQVLHHRVAALVGDGLGERPVGPVRLSGLHEQSRELSPGRAVVRPQPGDGAEGGYGGAAVAHFQRHQPHQEMGLDQLRRGVQHPPARGRGGIEPALGQIDEALLERLANPCRRFRTPAHGVVCSRTAR